MKRIVFAALVAVALTALSGCMAGAEEGITVLSTIFPPYDFAREITKGTDASVELLIKPGVDSHSFDPAPADIARVEKADLFLYIGGENDGWVERILGGAERDGGESLKLMDAVTVLNEQVSAGMQADAEEGGEPDQHIWTSPKNAMEMAKAIAEALCRLDEKNAAAYRQNLSDYLDRLTALDEEFFAIVEKAPVREMVFADRFPFLYFAERYGIRYYAAFPGCSSEMEPSARTLAFLIDKIRADGLRCVFHIEQGAVRVANSVAEEAGVKALLFHSCHNLTADELKAGESYLSLMEKNAAALKEGLSA